MSADPKPLPLEHERLRYSRESAREMIEEQKDLVTNVLNERARQLYARFTSAVEVSPGPLTDEETDRLELVGDSGERITLIWPGGADVGVKIRTDLTVGELQDYFVLQTVAEGPNWSATFTPSRKGIEAGMPEGEQNWGQGPASLEQLVDLEENLSSDLQPRHK